MSGADELLMAALLQKKAREDEKWKGAQYSPNAGMGNPYAAQAQDFTGADRRIEMQNEYANQLRGQAAPQGRRVGPSNIYVAPNWAESLRHGVSQGLGGYMAGKARRASEDLDAEKNAVLQAKIEQERSDIDRDYGLRQAASTLARDEYNTGISQWEAEQEAARLESRKHGEWTIGDETVQGYTEGGIAYRDNGDLMPDGATEVVKHSRSSGSRYSNYKGKDAHGNEVMFTFDKQDGVESPSRFIDGEPWSEEEAEARGKITAEQAGKVEREKNLAKTNVEKYGEAGKRIDAAQSAIGQYKIAQQALKEGANVGPIISKIPGIWTDATEKLRNAKDSTALTKIAMYTFGSLSEAEGEWLKDSSIPMNMTEEALGEWLDSKIQGYEQAIAADKYIEDMRKEGKEPDRAVIEAIKYANGFNFGQ